VTVRWTSTGERPAVFVGHDLVTARLG